MSKALFAGLGSIGQRHLINFKNITKDKYKILLYRQSDKNIIVENGIATQCESLAAHYQATQFHELKEALEQKPEIVFITNPSSKHLEIAIAAAKQKCNLFIEKPVAVNMEGIDELLNIVKVNHNKVMIGYQTRFNPCYKYLKNIIVAEKFGAILSAHFEWGTYLPSHHPYEDYRYGYAARNDLGGGVVLGLIHELDIIYSLWGEPSNIHAVGGKLSSLDMDVEDTVSILMKYNYDTGIFPVSLFLSYAQTKENRSCRIQFEKATLFINFSESRSNLYNERGILVEEKDFSHIPRNQLFLDEINAFLDYVNNGNEAVASLSDGINTLKIAIKIKELIK